MLPGLLADGMPSGLKLKNADFIGFVPTLPNALSSIKTKAANSIPPKIEQNSVFLNECAAVKRVWNLRKEYGNLGIYFGALRVTGRPCKRAARN